MSDIKSVFVITGNPTGKGDLGTCEQGWYVVSGDLITMTDSAGGPLRDDNTGRRIAMHLLPGEDEKSAAKKLTLMAYRAANRDEMAGFHRPIRYGKLVF